MNKAKAVQFVFDNVHTRFYQPVIFLPGIIEIEGRWHEATKNLADTLFKNIKGKTVLDLGCNTGFFVHEAIRNGAIGTTGVDYDAVAINKAKQINNILEHDAIFIQENIERYQPREIFDVTLIMAIYPPLRVGSLLKKHSGYTSEYFVLECDLDTTDLEGFDIVDRFLSPRVADQREIIFVKSSL